MSPSYTDNQKVDLLRRIRTAHRLRFISHAKYWRCLESYPLIEETLSILTEEQRDQISAKAFASAPDDLITRLRKENEQSASRRFSRKCGVCLTESPARRAVLKECGHALCLACAEQMKKDALCSRIVCPFCRTSSATVPLYEDEMDDIEDSLNDLSLSKSE